MRRLPTLALLAWVLVSAAQSAPAADVIINSSVTEYSDYTVNGRLILEWAGTLTVFGSLHVDDSIINRGYQSIPAITVSDNLFAGGDVVNEDFRDIVVQGVGTSFITGNLINSGWFTLGNGVAGSQLYLGGLANATGAEIHFLPNATLNVTGPINNSGDVTFQMADFDLAAGSTLNNSGTWNLSQGKFTNRGTVNNASGGLIRLDSGLFDNRGLVTNDGEIRLTLGDYLNASGANTNNNGTLALTRGHFQNSTGATLTNQGALTLSDGRFINVGTTQNVGGEIALTRGNFENQTGGTVNNSGTIKLDNGSYVNQSATNNQSGGRIEITAGDFENQAGTVTNDGQISSAAGKYINRATTTNRGEIGLASGNFENESGTVNNNGTIQLDNGSYVNRAGTNNQGNGLIALTAGSFENRSGTVTNDGEIRLTLGDYLNQAATLNNELVFITRGSFRNELGAVTNTGEIRLSLGDYVNAASTDNFGLVALSAGDLSNAGGFTFTNRDAGVVTLTSGRFLNRGTTQNFGAVRIASGAFENFGTTNNLGSIDVDSGGFMNHSGAMLVNQLGARIGLQSGAFENQAGATIQNDGTIQVSNGAFNGRGLMSGDGQLGVNGIATLYPGSMLLGNPTITATEIHLQGTVAPGGIGIPGQVTFNGPTHFQGLAQFDLFNPGAPGIGSDLIRITGGQTGHLEPGAEFHFPHLPANIGDKYEIIRGNVAVTERPLATDHVANRRAILRTDRDVTGFQGLGNAYYAYIGRDESLGDIAWRNAGRGNEITFGDYFDTATAVDDRAIGTAGADLRWIRDTLDLMPGEADVVNALGQMAGELYAPLGTISLQRQFLAYHQLARRLRQDLLYPAIVGGSVSPDTSEAWPEADDGEPIMRGQGGELGIPIRGWASGFGFGGSMAGDVNAGGASYGGGGVQIGFGYQPTERFGFGAFYDFGTFNLDHDGGDEAGASAHSWGGYATFERDWDYFLFAGGGGFADYRATRYLQFSNPHNAINRRAEGDHRGGQAAFYGEYGRKVCFGNASLRPYLGLLYMTVGQNEFQETGADALNLAFEDSALDSFRTLLGGQMDFRLRDNASLIWTLHGLWMHEYVNEATRGDQTAGLAATPGLLYVVAGPSSGRDWLVAGCGVRGSLFIERIQPFANYDIVINANQSFHTAWGGLEYVW